MKKVIAITTGGTIAMKYDREKDGLVPAVSGEDLLEAVPPLKGIAQVEVVEYSNVPSGHITPAMMFELAKLVDKKAADDEVAGIVITHGTDTIEETAYMLDLATHTQKPVCLTGAMRGASDMSWDGPGNILAAVQAAISQKMFGQGVTVVLNDQIHAASEVTKTHSVNMATFASPWWGPIGYVYGDQVVVKRHRAIQQKIYTDSLENDVYLLKTAAGMDGFLIECLIKKGVKGIVVEAFGCGNVPPAVKKAMEIARSHDIPVILATRVTAGRVAPIYSYEGSAGSLLSSGVILAEESSGQKARIKLMLALKASKNNAELQAYFTD
ncbi:asparaginase [Pectinatus haikarae]|uniref:L-asparaginase n=1 Tax=Pectinatus haikarae TaxID=349096 RepID=A0ABT9Y4M8_9FIRM|nr:asparaginase [Pectinatus haikarae]MDQ0202790.1 L-asparaginase [Pectinatus haikarae]